MLEIYARHNQFRESIAQFSQTDPHLQRLAQWQYQHRADWWHALDLDIPGIYILTGGRQVGKSTSCKLLIQHCLQTQRFLPSVIFYLPCDEIFDAKQLSDTLRLFLNSVEDKRFLLIIDEITFVQHWERVIKALADEGYFLQGTCILTGSDSLILKEAAMSFPGRRGEAEVVDFHLYPLSFAEYVKLMTAQTTLDNSALYALFENYCQTGGYLRAINDFAKNGRVTDATFLTYEQWIRGDFLKQGKSEENLLAVLNGLLTVGVSQISYSTLTQKIGLISKETCIDYCRLLTRMDVLFDLQAYDQNKKQGFPRKDRKFHLSDPFIYRTIAQWLNREGYLQGKLNHGGTTTSPPNQPAVSDSVIVEACVASHCHRLARTYYFKGQGEVDIIWLRNQIVQAIEVTWAAQVRANDLKALKQFSNSLILTKLGQRGKIDHIDTLPVYRFLYALEG